MDYARGLNIAALRSNGVGLSRYMPEAVTAPEQPAPLLPRDINLRKRVVFRTDREASILVCRAHGAPYGIVNAVGALIQRVSRRCNAESTHLALQVTYFPRDIIESLPVW